MKRILLIPFAAFCLAGCTTNYHEVGKADMNGAFMINSFPTFQGYVYEGSDADFHYFSGEWKYKKDKRFKIAKKDLTIGKETAFGENGTRIYLYKPEHIKVDTFATTEEGREIYVAPNG
ncbi:MAG: hypothetical protein AAF492_22045 [Verrucomicrobiota bacterium]